jgi:hypothetical protein
MVYIQGLENDVELHYGKNKKTKDRLLEGLLEGYREETTTAEDWKG